MIKKTENCLYCGEKMESKTAKKKFCCDLHRVYWNREHRIIKLEEGVTVTEKAVPFLKTNKGGNFKNAKVGYLIPQGDGGTEKIKVDYIPNPDNSTKIKELEDELKKVPDIGMGKKLRASIEKQIYKLKYQKQ